jgi:CRISPR-associated endonuclease/helicase Cas3
MSGMGDFAALFEELTGHGPFPWQEGLAQQESPRSLLIKIPTGFGKTEGVLATWLFHSLQRGDQRWPRRLVWCLPMRVLVEQTVSLAGSLCARVPGDIQPQVAVLMGGEDSGEWFLKPEQPAILIGTQDMLLSRALNRGYASARARWPMEFGLLNQDCLWVMDEVQLMDVGLATSAQLQAFRDQDHCKALRPNFTWWMSATLQPEWLRSVDTVDSYDEWVHTPCVIFPDGRTGDFWEISKRLTTDNIIARDTTTFAARILSEHNSLEQSSHGRITLVVCNTVQRAVETYTALQKAGRTDDLELVHSRFRPVERTEWRERFLSRNTCTRGVDRIIVATQVVEAGVDISSACLITELAPWPNLVQRFGRCARYGGTGCVLVIDRGQDEKSAAPYESKSLTSAWEAVQSLSDVGLDSLEAFEDALDPESRASLYPYQSPHLLMRNEYEELFDTTPDLTGADLDISRFIRSGDERDLQVFWAGVPKDETPLNTRKSHRRELCAVPFLMARDWLCGAETKSNRKPKLRGGMRAWVWDWIDGEWVTAVREMLTPGRIVCVAASCGGYLPNIGFAPESRTPVSLVDTETDTQTELLEQADNQQDGEPLSISEWKTIAFHCSEVAKLVERLALELELPSDIQRVLSLAARWHDLGKAHSAFQGKLRDALDEQRPNRVDLAKGPPEAWLKPPGHYEFLDDATERRPAFRHELASALALFSVLRLFAPEHPALLGQWKDVFEKLGQSFPTATETEPPAEIQEVLACTSEEFDLLAYLVASHHGKVRVALHAAPADQDYQPVPGDTNGLPIRGIRTGDRLPSISLTPDAPPLPDLPLTLEPSAMGLSFETGASWRERTQRLIERHGPATLGLLEALLRAADVRASRLVTEDPAFAKEASA